MKFYVLCTDSKGQTKRAGIEAPDEASARAIAERNGLTISHIEASSRGASVPPLTLPQPRPLTAAVEAPPEVLPASEPPESTPPSENRALVPQPRRKPRTLSEDARGAEMFIYVAMLILSVVGVATGFVGLIQSGNRAIDSSSFHIDRFHDDNAMGAAANALEQFIATTKTMDEEHSKRADELKAVIVIMAGLLFGAVSILMRIWMAVRNQVVSNVRER